MKLPPLVAENQLGSAAVELQPIDLPMQGSVCCERRSARRRQAQAPTPCEAVVRFSLAMQGTLAPFTVLAEHGTRYLGVVREYSEYPT